MSTNSFTYYIIYEGLCYYKKMSETWSIETLREHILALLDERQKQSCQRFDAIEAAAVRMDIEQKESVKAALAAQKELTSASFTASERAITKAEEAQTQYNLRSNEFRGQLDDQAKSLMPRVETVGLFKAVDDKIETYKRDMESKSEVLRQSTEKSANELRQSTEKSNEILAKDIANLRESRSQTEGKGIGNRELLAYTVAVISVISSMFLLFNRVSSSTSPLPVAVVAGASVTPP